MLVILGILGFTETEGLTQQSSFSWKKEPNCLQLLFPQTRFPAQSLSISQSPSPSGQGLSGVQQGLGEKFLPLHFFFIGEEVGSGLTQQSSFSWKKEPNCLQLLFPHTRVPLQSSSISQSPSPSGQGFPGVQQGLGGKFLPLHFLFILGVETGFGLTQQSSF